MIASRTMYQHHPDGSGKRALRLVTFMTAPKVWGEAGHACASFGGIHGLPSLSRAKRTVVQDKEGRTGWARTQTYGYLTAGHNSLDPP